MTRAYKDAADEAMSYCLETTNDERAKELLLTALNIGAHGASAEQVVYIIERCSSHRHYEKNDFSDIEYVTLDRHEAETKLKEFTSEIDDEKSEHGEWVVKYILTEYKTNKRY